MVVLRWLRGRWLRLRLALRRLRVRTGRIREEVRIALVRAQDDEVDWHRFQVVRRDMDGRSTPVYRGTVAAEARNAFTAATRSPQAVDVVFRDSGRERGHWTRGNR